MKLLFLSLYQLVTKNQYQILNFFVYVFVIVTNRKRHPGLPFSNGEQQKVITKFSIWFLVISQRLMQRNIFLFLASFLESNELFQSTLRSDLGVIKKTN